MSTNEPNSAKPASDAESDSQRRARAGATAASLLAIELLERQLLNRMPAALEAERLAIAAIARARG